MILDSKGQAKLRRIFDEIKIAYCFYQGCLHEHLDL